MRRGSSSESSKAASGAPSALERQESGLVVADGLVVPFHIVRSARRRRTLELRVEADGVRVAVPMRTPRHEVEAFVRSRIDWIRKQRRTRPTSTVLAFATGDVVPYLARPMPLEVVQGAGRATQVHVDLLGLRVTLARGTTAPRDATIEALRRWYRERATQEITDRVTAWAARAGYGPRRVLLRDQKRRWGSCAKDGTLRFNWRLVMLEPAIVDYVVVHEIAHLVRPHHRPSFWAEVERLIPDYRARRRRLGEQGAGLPL